MGVRGPPPKGPAPRLVDHDFRRPTREHPARRYRESKVLDVAEVVVVGPVDEATAGLVCRTVEAACAMYSQVTVNLDQAASIEPVVLAALLAMRDHLAAHDRTLFLAGITPTEQAARPARGERHARQCAAVSPRRTRHPTARDASIRPASAEIPHSAGLVTSDPGPTARLRAKSRPGEAHVLAELTSRLGRRFPFLPQETVEQAVRRRFHAYRDARIHIFVPILVERDVDDDLGRLPPRRRARGW